MSNVSLFYLTEPNYLTIVADQMIKDTSLGLDVIVITNRIDVANKLKSMGISATLVYSDRVSQEEHDRVAYQRFAEFDDNVFDEYSIKDMFIDRFRFWFQHHTKVDNVLGGMTVKNLYIQTSMMDSSPIHVLLSIQFEKYYIFLVDEAISPEGAHLLQVLSPETIFVSTKTQLNFARKIKRNNKVVLMETERKERPKMGDLTQYRKLMRRQSDTLILFDVRYEWDLRQFLDNNQDKRFYITPVNDRSKGVISTYLEIHGRQLISIDPDVGAKLADSAILFGYDYFLINGLPDHVSITIVDYFGKYESWLPLTEDKVKIL